MISFNLRVVSVAWGQARWAFQPFFEVWLVKPKQTASALRSGATKRQGRQRGIDNVFPIVGP